MKKGFAFLELLVAISLLVLVGSAVYVFVVVPPKVPELIVKKEPFVQQQLQSETSLEEKKDIMPPPLAEIENPVPPTLQAEPPRDVKPALPPIPPPILPEPPPTPPSSPSQIKIYSEFYNFPERFFNESIVSREQMIKVASAQYVSLKKMHDGSAPYIFARIEYDSPVYGSTIPNGIRLGDSAFPGLNGGNPRWEVMAHEQGHNFFGGTSGWYNTLAVPGPFLQESLAVLSAFYTYHNILENQQAFGIDGKTIESLNYDFANGRNFQKQQYELYISQGKKFDEQNVLTSQTLDYKMILYGETYGWHNYLKFAKAFENGLAQFFSFQNNGVSDVERSTYVIAALGVAFDKDFRIEFSELNFPIDDAYYAEIFPKIKDIVE